MRVVQIGMDQPDRDAFITRVGDAVRQRLDLGAVERVQNRPRGIDTLFHRVAHLARQQRFGKVEVQIILLEPAFGAHFDHVTEALGGDQRGLGPAPFDQRVGCQRGAVDDLREIGGRDPGLGADLMHPVDDRVLGRGIGGQHLG